MWTPIASTVVFAVSMQNSVSNLLMTVLNTSYIISQPQRLKLLLPKNQWKVVRRMLLGMTVNQPFPNKLFTSLTNAATSSAVVSQLHSRRQSPGLTCV